jgi:hypothetical protein
VGKFPNTVSGLIQWALHTAEAWCDELGLSDNPNKTGFVAFKRKLPVFFEPRLFGTTLHRSMSVKCLVMILDSRLTWREHVDVKVSKAQNLFWACRRAYGVTWGPETKDDSLALRHYHQALRHLCILGMVALLSDGLCQEETKQNPMISLLRDNMSNAHYSSYGCGSTYLPPPTGFSGTEGGEVSFSSSLESWILFVPTSQ